LPAKKPMRRIVSSFSSLLLCRSRYGKRLGLVCVASRPSINLSGDIWRSREFQRAMWCCPVSNAGLAKDGDGRQLAGRKGHTNGGSNRPRDVCCSERFAFVSLVELPPRRRVSSDMANEQIERRAARQTSIQRYISGPNGMICLFTDEYLRSPPGRLPAALVPTR
jgi:hypothetical protein